MGKNRNEEDGEDDEGTSGLHFERNGTELWNFRFTLHSRSHTQVESPFTSLNSLPPNNKVIFFPVFPMLGEMTIG